MSEQLNPVQTKLLQEILQSLAAEKDTARKERNKKKRLRKERRQK